LDWTVMVPMTLEHDIQNQIRIAISRHGKFFRVNIGQGWIGSDSVRILSGRMIEVGPGDVIVRNARRFSTGLPAGFSDLFGATPVIITVEMVGTMVAVFTTIEVKSDTGRVSPDQQNFIDVMGAAGCRVGVARSIEDAVAIINGEAKRKLNAGGDLGG